METHNATGSTWVVESETAFRLAVSDINANPFLLPDLHINPLFLDTAGSQAQALEKIVGVLPIQCVFQDRVVTDDSQIVGCPDDIVAVIGTGYSSAARPAATWSSVSETVMISPGSTWAGLQDKKEMPYFFRSVAPDTDAVKALAELASKSGWNNVALLMEATGAIEDNGTYQQFVESADRLGIRINVRLTFQGGLEAESQASFAPLLERLKAAGNTISVVFMRSVHYASFARACRQFGMLSEDYVWLTTNSILATDFYGPGVIFTDYQPTSAADEELGRVSQIWGQSTSSEDGAVLWDNGDGVPDPWALYVFDTVHLIAQSLAGLVREHGAASVGDGALLREQLLSSNYTGATGHIQFSKQHQDRVSTFVFLARTTPSEPLLLGSYSSGSDAAMQVSFEGLGWDRVPADGSELDAVLSSVASGPGRVQRGAPFRVLMAFSNRFREPVVPRTQLPAGMTVQWVWADSGEAMGDEEVVWRMAPFVNASVMLTTLEVTVQREGAVALSVAFEGRELSGFPLNIMVDGNQREDAASDTGNSVSTIIYIVVSSVFVLGLGGLVGWLVWRHPQFARLMFNLVIEFVNITMTIAARILDVVTDALAAVAVIEDPELQHIELWYLCVLGLSAGFVLLEVYVTFRDCVLMRHDMEALVKSEVSQLHVYKEQYQRSRNLCALSLLNCLVQGIPMTALNIMIIVTKDASASSTMVYEISVLVNFLMLGWKFADVKVQAQLRKDDRITQKFENYVERVASAAEHVDQALEEMEESEDQGAEHAAASSHSSRKELAEPHHLLRNLKGSSFFTANNSMHSLSGSVHGLSGSVHGLSGSVHGESSLPMRSRRSSHSGFHSLGLHSFSARVSGHTSPAQKSRCASLSCVSVDGAVGAGDGGVSDRGGLPGLPGQDVARGEERGGGGGRENAQAGDGGGGGGEGGGGGKGGGGGEEPASALAPAWLLERRCMRKGLALLGDAHDRSEGVLAGPDITGSARATESQGLPEQQLQQPHGASANAGAEHAASARLLPVSSDAATKWLLKNAKRHAMSAKGKVEGAAAPGEPAPDMQFSQRQRASLSQSASPPPAIAPVTGGSELESGEDTPRQSTPIWRIASGDA